MYKRFAHAVADLATQQTLELSNVLSLSESPGVSLKALFTLLSIFPSLNVALYLQCSQVLRSNELSVLFLSSRKMAKNIEVFGQSGYKRGILTGWVHLRTLILVLLLFQYNSWEYVMFHIRVRKSVH